MTRPAVAAAGLLEEELALHKAISGDWVELDSTVNTIARTVSAEIASFSVYGILQRTPGPPGVAVDESNLVPISENGGTTSFTVQLEAEPIAGQVALDVSVADTGEVLLSHVDCATTAGALSLTFTAEDWSLAREIIVCGQDDDAADGDQSVAIALSIDAPSTTALGYDESLAIDDVTVVVTDDETAGFVVDTANLASGIAGGGSTSFTIRLTQEPEGEVTLLMTGETNGLGGVSVDACATSSNAETLIFNAANFATPQTFHVCGLDIDGIVTGGVTESFTVAVDDANTVTPYQGVAVPGVAAFSVDIYDADVVYVIAGGTGSANGTSWVDALATVQAGIDAAVTDNKDEVWVAAGDYVDATIAPVLTMRAGVDIYGGFAGTELSLAGRPDPVLISTLNGNGNSYHVVVGASNARLDGFTITSGNASGVDPNDRGGGIYNTGVSGLVLNGLIVSANSAVYGGGMYNVSSSPTLTNVTFSNNSTTSSVLTQ